MSIEKVKAYFKTLDIDHRILEFSVSSATVELAAKALGCKEAEIAKTLSFYVGNHVVLIVTSGDQKIDNQKYKSFFQTKAKMLSLEDAPILIGHEVGGICPFALNEGVDVYLDISLTRFDYVYPACGSSNSAIKLSIDELQKYAQSQRMIDVCKPYESD